VDAKTSHRKEKKNPQWGEGGNKRSLTIQRKRGGGPLDGRPATEGRNVVAENVNREGGQFGFLTKEMACNP